MDGARWSKNVSYMIENIKNTSRDLETIAKGTTDPMVQCVSWRLQLYCGQSYLSKNGGLKFSILKKDKFGNLEIL